MMSARRITSFFQEEVCLHFMLVSQGNNRLASLASLALLVFKVSEKIKHNTSVLVTDKIPQQRKAGKSNKCRKYFQQIGVMVCQFSL